MSLDMIRLEHEGFLLMQGVSEKDLVDLAQQLGLVRVDRRSPDQVREIHPQTVQFAKDNTLSSRYGTDAFPFHTDTAHWERPAAYLVLYCVNPGDGNRKTLLQDSRVWQFTDAQTELACRALWKTGHVRPRLCMLGEQTKSGLTIRYDKDCMRPMTAEAHELAALVEFRIGCSRHTQIDWQPKSLLVIDNRRMLHARGKSDQPDTGRVLKRILIGGA